MGLFGFKLVDSANDFSPLIYIGELVGTFFFLTIAYLLASTTNVLYKNEGLIDSSQVQTIAMGFGFGLSSAIIAFGDLSGGHYNPAVALAFVFTGDVSLLRWLLELVVQLCGAMAAAGAVSAWIAGPVNFANSLGADVSIGRGLTIEAFTTFMLIITIFVVVRKGFHPLACAFPIGVSLFLGHLIAIPNTGAGLNPARTFGPCVAERDFPSYHWIYWLGPFIGALFAALLRPLAIYSFDRDAELIEKADQTLP